MGGLRERFCHRTTHHGRCGVIDNRRGRSHLSQGQP
jgi:hypothetical protein